MLYILTSEWVLGTAFTSQNLPFILFPLFQITLMQKTKNYTKINEKVENNFKRTYLRKHVRLSRECPLNLF